MGMFDDVKCSYPLPGEVPEFIKSATFQTKDLGCLLDTYEITESGQLVKREPGGGVTPETDFHGDLDFYTSNVAGGGPGIYTRNGEDAVSVEYRARFDAGQLRDIALTEYTVEPALPISEMSRVQPLTDAQVAAWRQHMAESLVGRRMFVRYGSFDPNYKGDAVEIVLENDRQLVARKDDGTFELLDRRQRESTLFDSAEAAVSSKQERQSSWDDEKRKYVDYARQWKAARAAPSPSTPHQETRTA